MRGLFRDGADCRSLRKVGSICPKVHVDREDGSFGNADSKRRESAPSGGIGDEPQKNAENAGIYAIQLYNGQVGSARFAGFRFYGSYPMSFSSFHWSLM